MIEFMIIAAPRCGTTWAANWLSTDSTLCIHDPLYTKHYSELDSIYSNKMLGVSCTGLYHFPDFINSHPARKVILHRPIGEINKSLELLGLPGVRDEDINRLNTIKGKHFAWTELFNNPSEIYEYLLLKRFDSERFNQIKHIEMQPRFCSLPVSKEVTARLILELQGDATWHG